MTRDELFEQIRAKRSFLCVGLDADFGKTGAQFEFNRGIVEATAEYAVAYKPNLAFYEERGAEGWDDFVCTCAYIRERHPDIFIIADAKRGDIGNTAELYARAFFDAGLVDAVTLSPYMGRDTVEPFLKHDGRWAVILALTSNPSAADFETLELAGGEKLYERVLRASSTWGTTENTMYVVGATRAQELAGVRRIVPDHFLLVPGVGAQGGSLQEVAEHGMNGKCGLLVNSSRGIIYAPDPAAAAREVQMEMSALLDKYL